MCGITIKELDIAKFDSIGVKDSKLLTPQFRESIYHKILKIAFSHEIIISSPEKIDEILNSKDMNLNWLEAKTSAQIINKLNPDKAILDCPSTNIKAYKDYVTNLLKKDTKLIVEHKADYNYVVVAAASVIAKVTRDRIIEEIKSKIGIDIGSGYPSDPTTQEFLKKNWSKYPEIFRKSWATYKKQADSKKQSSLGDF